MTYYDAVMIRAAFRAGCFAADCDQSEATVERRFRDRNPGAAALLDSEGIVDSPILSSEVIEFRSRRAKGVL